jgi:hypothetical protein
VVSRGRPERDDRSGERRIPARPAAAERPTPPLEEPSRSEPPSFAVTSSTGAPAPGFGAERVSRVSERHRGRVETPFGNLHRPGDADRIVAALAAGGIFPVTARRAPLAPISPVAAAPTPARRLEREPETTTAPIARPLDLLPAMPAAKRAPAPTAWPASAELASFEAAPAAVEEPDEIQAAAPAAWGEVASTAAPAPPPGAPAPPEESAAAASTTLGSLYLAQGHLDDAEESFEAVLRTRPGDGEARRGLDEVRRRKSEAAAAFFDELPPQAPASAAVVGGLTARKIDLLRQFMARMRRGGATHVS